MPYARMSPIPSLMELNLYPKELHISPAQNLTMICISSNVYSLRDAGAPVQVQQPLPSAGVTRPNIRTRRPLPVGPQRPTPDTTGPLETSAPYRGAKVPVLFIPPAAPHRCRHAIYTSAPWPSGGSWADTSAWSM